MASLTVNGKTINVGFTFGTVYRLDKACSTKDADGTPQNDGAVNVWDAVLRDNADALVALVQCSTPETVNTADVVAALDRLDDVSAFFDQVKDEAKHSGFFNRTITQFKHRLEKMQKAADQIPDKTPEQKAAIESLTETIQTLNDYLS